MHFEDFRTWHWMIIGLLVGALFGGVKLWQGPWFNSDQIDSMDQLRFEHALIGKPDGGTKQTAQFNSYLTGKQLLKDVVVHPPMAGEPTGAYWVTGKICSMQQINEVPNDPQTPVV